MKRCKSTEMERYRVIRDATFQSSLLPLILSYLTLQELVLRAGRVAKSWQVATTRAAQSCAIGLTINLYRPLDPSKAGWISRLKSLRRLRIEYPLQQHRKFLLDILQHNPHLEDLSFFAHVHDCKIDIADLLEAMPNPSLRRFRFMLSRPTEKEEVELKRTRPYEQDLINVVQKLAHHEHLEYFEWTAKVGVAGDESLTQLLAQHSNTLEELVLPPGFGQCRLGLCQAIGKVSRCLTSLELQEEPAGLTSTGLRSILHCTKLDNLSISDYGDAETGSLTNDVFLQLDPLPSLTWLSLGYLGPDVDETGLKTLLQLCPNLRNLMIDMDAPLGSFVLTVIADTVGPLLEYLSLGGSADPDKVYNLSDALIFLRSAPNLTHFSSRFLWTPSERDSEAALKFQWNTIESHGDWTRHVALLYAIQATPFAKRCKFQF